MTLAARAGGFVGSATVDSGVALVGTAQPVVRDAEVASDGDGVWAILEPTFRRGDTYAVDPSITRGDALAGWFDHARVRVAVHGDLIVGTYYLGPNQAGPGSHVANCGYAVDVRARGAGVGRLMGLDSLAVARADGFRAMQFNLVVSTNDGAVHLWRSLGFEVLGTIPEGFDHPENGLVDAHVMHRLL